MAPAAWPLSLEAGLQAGVSHLFQGWDGGWGERAADPPAKEVAEAAGSHQAFPAGATLRAEVTPRVRSSDLEGGVTLRMGG